MGAVKGNEFLMINAIVFLILHLLFYISRKSQRASFYVFLSRRSNLPFGVLIEMG